MNTLICGFVTPLLLNLICVKGIVSLLAAIKSRKCADENESKRLEKTSRQISTAGILISLVLIGMSLAMYFLNEKLFNFINLNEIKLIYSNRESDKANSTSQTTRRLANKTRATGSKHKLHYEEQVNVQPAGLSASTLSTQADQTKTTTSSVQINEPNVKYYDRLTILLDHNLLENLKFEYEIFNKTNNNN